MRLITYQDKDAKRVLEEGVWYSTRGYRVKPIDEKYIDELGKIKHYPIYTFATTGKRFDPYFSLTNFSHDLCHLTGYMQFDLTQMVMIELEVPEEFILNMKVNAYWYTKACDKEDPKCISAKRDRRSGEFIYYAADYSQGDYYESSYLSKARELRREHEFEAIILCIKKEHVVAIREFDSEDGGYNDHTCRTIYTNDDLCPLWYGPIVINGQSNAKLALGTDEAIMQEIGEADYVDLPSMEYILQDYYGAKAVPGYFTVAEALACGNAKLYRCLKTKMDSLDIDKKDYDSIRLSSKSGLIYTEDGIYRESIMLKNLGV